MSKIQEFRKAIVAGGAASLYAATEAIQQVITAAQDVTTQVQAGLADLAQLAIIIVGALAVYVVPNAPTSPAQEPPADTKEPIA